MALVPVVANGLLVLLSLVMGLRLLRQYTVRSRMHTLWYAVGLLLTAVAAVPELYVKLFGGLVAPLWLLYWVAGSSLVGFLAVGTAYLLSDTAGKTALLAVSALTAWLIVAVALSAGAPPAEVTEATLSRAPNAIIKAPFLIQNILGALLIMGGALWSYVRTRGVYNLWIALGTLVFSSGGAAAGVLHVPGVFHFTQAVGIVLLYLGVTGAGAPRITTVRAGV